MANTKLIAAVVIVIVIIAGGSVVAWQLMAPSEQTIKIGLVAPYQIPVGKDMDRAARMAVKEINDAGGIYVEDLGAKLKIELLIADTEDTQDTEVAITAVTRVIEQGADLLIGGFS
ncbi:MAG: ABC transporter substrate-binding protein, partial [Candidatus Bathyarchaeia archaeon]|nr:ABC transporter substrate-binding protein [Candidatus Bathyarchaeia archaeon]